jgi:hypothetical protein
MLSQCIVQEDAESSCTPHRLHRISWNCCSHADRSEMLDRWSILAASGEAAWRGVSLSKTQAHIVEMQADALDGL